VAAAAKEPTKVKEEPLEPNKEVMGYAQQAAFDDIDLEEDDELAAAEKAKQADMESRKGAGQANDNSSSPAATTTTGTIQEGGAEMDTSSNRRKAEERASDEERSSKTSKGGQQSG
jgi:hypothetical protein